jgi:hypothetical protein
MPVSGSARREKFAFVFRYGLPGSAGKAPGRRSRFSLSEILLRLEEFLQAEMLFWASDPDNAPDPLRSATTCNISKNRVAAMSQPASLAAG